MRLAREGSTGTDGLGASPGARISIGTEAFWAVAAVPVPAGVRAGGGGRAGTGVRTAATGVAVSAWSFDVAGFAGIGSVPVPASLRAAEAVSPVGISTALQVLQVDFDPGL